MSKLKQYSHFLMLRLRKYAEVELWQITRYKMALRTQVLSVTQAAFETMLRQTVPAFSLSVSSHFFSCAGDI